MAVKRCPSSLPTLRGFVVTMMIPFLVAAVVWECEGVDRLVAEVFGAGGVPS